MTFKCCFGLKGILLTKETLQKLIDEKYNNVEVRDITEFVEDAFGFMNDSSMNARVAGNIEMQRDYMRKIFNTLGFKLPHPEYDEPELHDFNDNRLKEIQDALIK